MKTSTGKYRGRLITGAALCLYPILIAGLLYPPLTRTHGQIETLLTFLISKVLWVNFLLIIIGLYLCRRDMAASFMELWPGVTADSTGRAACAETPYLRRCLQSPGFVLLVICLAGLFLVTFIAPQTHRLYFDEDIYGNMAQNMAYRGQTGMASYGVFEYGEYFVNWILYNKDPGGWPFLVSLAFQLFGTDESWLFYLNNLLFTAGIVISFFIARLIAGDVFPGLLAAALYALIPHNLVWSNTGAAETSAAVFGGLTVLCTLVYRRSRAARHLFLLFAVMSFAGYLRPESALICLWVLAALAATRGGEKHPESRPPLATAAFWIMALIPAVLLIPLAWHFIAMSGQSWGAAGAKFSAAFLPKNLATNGLYYLKNGEFPLPFTLLALAGFLAWRRHASAAEERDSHVDVALMLFWFLLFWGIFLFFYAGSYRYGTDVRFALLSFMPLAVLAGLGGETLRRAVTAKLPALPPATFTAILVAVLLFSWMKFMPLVRLVGQEAWGARYDHLFAREFTKKIPQRSMVLTHNPTMFLLWGQNAIQTFAGINNPEMIADFMRRYNGHVYFHYNYWCNAVNDVNQTVCKAIEQKYLLEPVARAREQQYEYGLYRMSLK